MSEATTDPNRETLTWEGYGKAARELAQQVADSAFDPDIILAIARGGLFAAGSLGYALSVKNLYVMNLEFYTGVGERLDVDRELAVRLADVDRHRPHELGGFAAGRGHLAVRFQVEERARVRRRGEVRLLGVGGGVRGGDIWR